MPVIISQIKCRLDEDGSAAVSKALKREGISKSDVLTADIYKSSIDARRQNDIRFVYSVIVWLKDESREQSLAAEKKLIYMPAGDLDIEKGSRKQDGRIVIAGFGPAGMFCALTLAENGYRPIVIERGSPVDERVKKVNTFWQGGALDTETNVQFGEGGAGTFSDGKLTTRIKDPLCRHVLEKLVSFGAPEEILTKAKPHIGTDKLRGVVKAIRERILELGGEIYFNTRLDDIAILGDRAVSVKAGDGHIKSSCLVIAIGHSARDTAKMLLSRNIEIEAKPFAVGARIEHLQSQVNKSLYGSLADDPRLPAGEYQMSYTQKDGQSCYTFCMCPGGVVVPAASEHGGVVVNGMSEYARDGKNANAAVVVAVNKNDFGSSALGGMDFAAEIERRAYRASGSYLAPATSVKGFLEGKPSLDISTEPTYALGVTQADLDSIFPSRVTAMMRRGLGVFAGRMKCFADGAALLTAPETRTSSPIRMLRNEQMKAAGYDNIYPCGEGAGYAGGITSSAVDGIKTALQIMAEFES